MSQPQETTLDFVVRSLREMSYEVTADALDRPLDASGLGMDSLTTLELTMRISETLNVVVSAEDSVALLGWSPRQLASWIDARRA